MTLIGGAATAADLKGPYVGVQLGWAESKVTVEDSDCATSQCSAYSTAALGATNGIQMGWNWISGNLLASISADYSHGGIKTSLKFGDSKGVNSGIHYDEANAKFRDVVTLRLRVGLVVDDTAIVVSAGSASARFDSELRYTAGDQDPTNDYYSSRKGVTTGLVTGVSIEHAMADHVTIALGVSQYSFKNEHADWYYAGDGSLYDGYVTNHTYSLQNADLSLYWRF